jgi:SAM-dependent methyltransferase
VTSGPEALPEAVTRPNPSIRPREGSWWRLQRQILRAWIDGGLPRSAGRWALKTDLFDEASGPHHHFTDLTPHFHVAGIDVDLVVASAAQKRLAAEGRPAPLLVCDVRALPLASASLSLVLSLSTLDHFDSTQAIHDSLKEIARTLAPGGRLLLTLDNPWNPEVFLRSHLPPAIVRRIRADTFPLGMTMSSAQAKRAFTSLGLEILIQRYLIHGPRFPAIRLLHWLERAGARGLARWLELALLALEVLSRGPLGAVTGHYTGWWLVKTARSREGGET